MDCLSGIHILIINIFSFMPGPKGDRDNFPGMVRRWHGDIVKPRSIGQGVLVEFSSSLYGLKVLVNRFMRRSRRWFFYSIIAPTQVLQS